MGENGWQIWGQLLAQLWVLSAAHSLGIHGAWELPRGHLALGATWFHASYGLKKKKKSINPMGLKQNIALKGVGRVLKQPLASSLSPASHLPLTLDVTLLDSHSLAQIASLGQKL